MSSNYVRLQILDAPTELSDEISALCFQFGATGISEVLKYTQTDLTYDPTIRESRTVTWDVFFTEQPAVELITGLKLLEKNLQTQFYVEENKDWLAEWKKGFTSFKLSGPYWIVPSWLKPPPEAEVPLFIEPGMAFGTGTHATTRMAASFVRSLNKQKNSLFNTSLIDVGTGTGLLALLAEHEGVGEVIAMDIDPEATRVARENLLKNSSSRVTVVDEPLEEIFASFDFVVANIIDGVLLQIQKDLLRVLKPDGSLFVTGILVEREEQFIKKFIDKNNLKVNKRLEDQEWVGFWLTRSS